MNICFISRKYPNIYATSDYVFVKNLVEAIAEMGNDCYVLAPFSMTHYKGKVQARELFHVGHGTVTVIRPSYISLGNAHIGKFYFTDWLQKRAIKKAYHMMKLKPDVIYGHFWVSAYNGYEIAKKNNIPLFVASGESRILSLFRIPADVESFRIYIKGVVCVSSKNRDESIELGLTVAEKCGVFPNAVNTDLFYKREREECRKRLGLPRDAFIVAFVGWFNKRKGASRVAEAISRIQGEKVYSMFIGNGGTESHQDPRCEGILFKGVLPHEKVPLYLGAADCFVLPTLHEGCCNAVIEAMACGLPVISSNLPFNWDVLDNSNSIMVNPENIDEISDAIRLLRDNVEFRKKLADGALKRASDLTISKRAEAIMHFIEGKIG